MLPSTELDVQVHTQEFGDATLGARLVAPSELDALQGTDTNLCRNLDVTAYA